MRRRFFTSLGALAVTVAGVSLATVPVAGQGRTDGGKAAAAAKAWTPPKTAWGDPDLQGVYTFSTQTPLERPAALSGKETLTEAELQDLEEKAAEGRAAEGTPLRPGDPGTYNNFWTSTEKGRLTGRTSLIVDPPGGRKPPMTPQAEKIRQQLVAEASARRVGTPPFVSTIYDSWADHPAYTRCVARPMPRVGQSYNHGIQVLQSPGYVVIFYESMHDARIVPLDGRPHLDKSIQLWNGDSRGHWEGNTLVIDWANFTDKQEWEGSPQGSMHFVERLTRIDAKTIKYEVAVDAPTIWTSPWKFDQPWRADDANYQQPEDLYEYACHEGNYRTMQNSLVGSRLLKEEAAKKSSSK